MKPSGSCLMALSPDDPVQVVGGVVVGVGDQVEQSFELGNGERDQPGVARWLLVVAVGQDRLWPSGFLGGGGDGADGEGGHGERDVAEHGGVEADLAVVESEVVFAELERFFDRPPQARAVVVGQLTADPVLADEHIVMG